MRKPREIMHGFSYHIVARINRQEFIFRENGIREMFLNIVIRAKQKYQFKIKNFCIMGNHIHFILKPLGNENLSRIMQWILSVFAIKFNRTFKIIGHVWYDRFRSKLILSYQQYLRTFIYITNNPVRANIVTKAVNYKYNGIKFIQNGIYTIIEKPPKKLFNEVIKKYLSTTK